METIEDYYCGRYTDKALHLFTTGSIQFILYNIIYNKKKTGNHVMVRFCMC